jgi:hypothetical protein
MLIAIAVVRTFSWFKRKLESKADTHLSPARPFPCTVLPPSLIQLLGAVGLVQHKR